LSFNAAVFENLLENETVIMFRALKYNMKRDPKDETKMIRYSEIKPPLLPERLYLSIVPIFITGFPKLHVIYLYFFH
jgi:hypothetical protein